MIQVTATAEERDIEDLVDQEDDDSDSETEEEDNDDDTDELGQILQQDSDSSIEKQALDMEEIALQEVGNAIWKSKRTTAGVK